MENLGEIDFSMDKQQQYDFQTLELKRTFLAALDSDGILP
jgi:hypothetical protein